MTGVSEPGPSRTAQGVAMLRAAHQILDAPPPILDDSVVLALIGATTVERIRNDPERANSPLARALRAHVVLRSRFAEDRLAIAAADGVTQYVVLGAGYDTFAYRQPAWARSLHVIEVDQPSTQELKRAQLSAAGIDVPANVRYAAVDFERESLRDGLLRTGISLDRPTFFSWLGVTMYLTRESVEAVLRAVASCPKRSEIVFTFSQPPRPEELDTARSPTLAEMSASVGEPWLTYFEPESLERTLRDIGFALVEFLTPAVAHDRYFAGRVDGLSPPKRTAIVSAVR
jgi:methyltransferase (TIGR00027 family)